MTASLDVIIVSFRCERLLRDCLGSIKDHPPAGPLAVHVVDNDSRDGTAEMVEREFPELQLHRAGSNLGFSRANNLPLPDCRGRYVLFLNPDTLITPGSLDRLLDLMEHRGELGMCGPRLELPDGSFDHASSRRFPSPVSALGHFTGLARRSDGSGQLAGYRADEAVAGPVDAVNGAFMLTRRSALDEVGPLDESYWMYMEDLDLCWRLACRGWLCWFEPSVTVIHVKGGSAGYPRPLKLNLAFHSGMRRYYRANYARRRGSFTNLTVEAGIGAKLAVSLVRSGPGLLRRRLRSARG